MLYMNICMAPYYIHKYLYETSTSRVLEIGRIRRLQKSGVRSAGAFKRAASEAPAPAKERRQMAITAINLQAQAPIQARG